MIIIGIDIGKNKHEATLIDEKGNIIGKSIKFENSTAGFNKLISSINNYNISNDKFVFSMEATGHYWLALFSKLVESVEQREDNLNCYISDHLCYSAWFQPNNISSRIFLGSWSEGGKSLDINVINANILKKSKKVINYKKWADKQNIKNPGAWLILDISQKGSGFYLAGHQNELSFDLNLLDNTHNFDAIFIVQGSRVAKIDG